LSTPKPSQLLSLPALTNGSLPANALIDILLAFNIFGQETLFSWIPESMLRIFFYRDLSDLAPQSEGLFTENPMVNSDIFHQIRAGNAEWLRGDIIGFTENGVRFNYRAKGVPKGGPGRENVVGYGDHGYGLSTTQPGLPTR